MSFGVFFSFNSHKFCVVLVSGKTHAGHQWRLKSEVQMLRRISARCLCVGRRTATLQSRVQDWVVAGDTSILLFGPFLCSVYVASALFL